jgi:multiple antibiotic resistance protein
MLKKGTIALNTFGHPNASWTGFNILLIAFYQEHHSITDIIFAILAIFCSSSSYFIVFKSAHYLAKILELSGIVAISRIGFIVIAIEYNT